MILFIKDPPGKFRSRYAVGGTARFDIARERILIQKGYAVEISEEANEGNTRGLQPDDSIVSGSEAVSTGNDRSDRSGQHHNKPNPRKRSRN